MLKHALQIRTLFHSIAHLAPKSRPPLCVGASMI